MEIIFVEFAPSLKTQNLLKLNIIVAIISLLALYYLDSPLELIGATGIAWVLISTVEAIRKLRRQNVEQTRLLE